MKLLVFFTIFSIFMKFSSSQDLFPYIYRGKKAREGQFPHQVIIHYAYPGLSKPRHICSGSIISPRWILTARHCFETTDPPDHWLHYRIVVGSIYRNKGVSYKIEKGIKHPGDIEDWHTDIALFKLKTKIKFNWKTKPIPIYKHWVYPFTRVVLSGWGDDENKDPVDRLMYVNMRTVPNWVCERWIATTNNTDAIDALLPLTNQDLCAYAGETRGACYGDSGSGLVYQGKLVGVVSRGIPCATSVPDIFIRISKYSKWIQETIRIG